MCGIVTLLGSGTPGIVRQLLSATAHRGPDSQGYREFEGCTLAMNRLAIQDPRAVADQPMSYGHHHLVYNGELYNTVPLRDELRSRGHDFRTTGDTEVILHAIAEWGAAACDRFEGMYALTCWDAERRVLLVARDELGIKPLYWAAVPEGILFVSEASPLAAVTEGRPRREAVAEFLALGSAISAPAWDSVGEVEAGTRSEWTADRACRAEVIARTHARPAESCSELPALVTDVVDEHLVSDRPVVLFLSGGFDSALVAAATRRLGRPVPAITIATGENAGDVARATRTANRLGLDHEVVTIADQELGSHLRSFLASLDQPTIDGFNTWLVSRVAAQRGFPVALSGLGGDELFGAYGYSRLGGVAMRLGRTWRHLPRGMRHVGARAVARVSRHDAERVEAILDSRSAAELHRSWRTLFTSKEVAAMTGGEVELSARWTTDPVLDLRTQLRTVDLNTYLRPVLLRDSDVFSMAHGVELRVPLVDRRLFAAVEAAGPTFDRASFARQASEPLLVECAAEPKLPFSLPWRRWLEGPL
jgi:asparagine synthase (glutamine-hydrolysing)